MQTSQFSKFKPKRIEGVIQKDHGLNAIYKKTNQIQAASQILAQTLPKDLLQHCFVANIQYGLITICAKSAVWSTHLRYYHQKILKGLQNCEEFRHIHSIRFRLAKLRASPLKQERTINMSKSTSSTIAATANSITNPTLKEALLRLAKHGS